jgi:hypothetical protein
MDVEFDKENGRSSSPSQHCGSANRNTQLHNMIISHGGCQPPKQSATSHSTSHQTVTTVNKSKKWWK